MCLFVVPDLDVCKLYCFAEGYDFFFALSSKVKDGTLCSQDSSDVCIDGICEVMYNIHNILILTQSKYCITWGLKSLSV